MCKIGDIIVVDKYIAENGKEVAGHSFIVVDDEPKSIGGLNYDLVTSVMSSFKNEEHKKKKLSFKENLEIILSEIHPNPGVKANAKEGYVKADQVHFFNKKKINYFVFGHVSQELLDKLLDLIVEFRIQGKLIENCNNIKEPTEQK